MTTCSSPPLAHVHLPKTAGTWVRELMLTHGGAHSGHAHGPVWGYPYGVRQSHTTFGVTRCPMAWYVSHWLYAINDQYQPANSALLAYGRGEHSFEAVLWGLTHPGELPAVPHPITILTQPDGVKKGQGPTHTGLWSWLHAHTYGERGAWETWQGNTPLDFGVDVLIDQAQLIRGMELLTGWKDIGLKPPANTAARRGRRGGWLQRKRVSDWYTAEMVAWVDKADGQLMSQLGYGGFAPSTLGPLPWTRWSRCNEARAGDTGLGVSVAT